VTEDNDLASLLSITEVYHIKNQFASYLLL